jgi:hypothetical protein
MDALSALPAAIAAASQSPPGASQESRLPTGYHPVVPVLSFASVFLPSHLRSIFDSQQTTLQR